MYLTVPSMKHNRLVCKQKDCNKRIERYLLHHQEGNCQKCYGKYCLFLDMCKRKECFHDPGSDGYCSTTCSILDMTTAK